MIHLSYFVSLLLSLLLIVIASKNYFYAQDKYFVDVIFFLIQGVTNFVVFKFGTLAQKEWQTMYDLAKMFLHCLNHWKLWPPASRGQQLDEKDENDYKLNYTRLDRLTLWISLLSFALCLVTLVLELADKTLLYAVCKLTYLVTQINIFFFFLSFMCSFTSTVSVTKF